MHAQVAVDDQTRLETTVALHWSNLCLHKFLLAGPDVRLRAACASFRVPPVSFRSLGLIRPDLQYL